MKLKGTISLMERTGVVTDLEGTEPATCPGYVLKNVARALHTDGGRCRLSVAREVKIEIPAWNYGPFKCSVSGGHCAIHIP